MTPVDAVVFDCDGVLVDVSESYDAAIGATVSSALSRFAGVSSIPVDREVIEMFKSTGGFNNEIDLAYAAILSLAAAGRLGMEPRRFIADVADNADESGIVSVEGYLDTLTDMSDVRGKISYPGDGRGGQLNSMFDQIFYGHAMYERLFGGKAEIRAPGFIESDRLILSRDLLDEVSGRVCGRLAIVTGRGLDSTRHSLGSLMDYFDLDSCMFLEDEPRHLAKPNPEPLRRAVMSLSANNALYVGDSMEDAIMARAVSEAGHAVTFCGIVGTSRNPREWSGMFERAGADIILESIHDIPDAVEFA